MIGLLDHFYCNHVDHKLLRTPLMVDQKSHHNWKNPTLILGNGIFLPPEIGSSLIPAIYQFQISYHYACLA